MDEVNGTNAAGDDWSSVTCTRFPCDYAYERRAHRPDETGTTNHLVSVAGADDQGWRVQLQAPSYPRSGNLMRHGGWRVALLLTGQTEWRRIQPERRSLGIRPVRKVVDAAALDNALELAAGIMKAVGLACRYVGE